MYRLLFIVSSVVSLAICALFTYFMEKKEDEWHFHSHAFAYVTSALFTIVTASLIYWIVCLLKLVKIKFGKELKKETRLLTTSLITFSTAFTIRAITLVLTALQIWFNLAWMNFYHNKENYTV